MSKLTLKDIVAQRDKVYGLLQERRALGAFDANAGSIVAIMESQMVVLTHLISEAEEKKRAEKK